MPFGVWIFTPVFLFPESSINAAPRCCCSAGTRRISHAEFLLLPRIIYASSKPVLLMFFSLTDPAVFLPDHAICFIITHNEKMHEPFSHIFFQKDQFSRLFFYLRTLFFSQLPCCFPNSAALLSACSTIFHQFPYFQAAQSHFFPLAGPVPGDTGRKYLRGNLLFKMIIGVEIFQQIRQFSIMCCCKDRAHLHGAGQQAHSLTLQSAPSCLFPAAPHQ